MRPAGGVSRQLSRLSARRSLLDVPVDRDGDIPGDLRAGGRADGVAGQAASILTRLSGAGESERRADAGHLGILVPGVAQRILAIADVPGGRIDGQIARRGLPAVIARLARVATA